MFSLSRSRAPAALSRRWGGWNAPEGAWARTFFSFGGGSGDDSGSSDDDSKKGKDKDKKNKSNSEKDDDDDVIDDGEAPRVVLVKDEDAMRGEATFEGSSSGSSGGGGGGGGGRGGGGGGGSGSSSLPDNNTIARAGDVLPRVPSLLAIPTTQRPLMPYFFAERLLVTDRELADRVRRLLMSGAHTNRFVGVFKRLPGEAADAADAAEADSRADAGSLDDDAQHNMQQIMTLGSDHNGGSGGGSGGGGGGGSGSGSGSNDPFARLEELGGVGGRVEARWKGGLEWYAGTIVHINANGTAAIDFDDGDKESEAQVSDIRPPGAGSMSGSATTTTRDSGLVTSAPPLALADLHRIGTYGFLHNGRDLGNGALELGIVGIHRVRATGPVDGSGSSSSSSSSGGGAGGSGPLSVHVDHLENPRHHATAAAQQSDTVRATMQEISFALRQLFKVSPSFKDLWDISHKPGFDLQDPYYLSDIVAGVCNTDHAALQDILETLNVEERLHKALLLLRREIDIATVQADIRTRIQEGTEEQNRKFFLTQQLKEIKKELGLEQDDKDALIGKFRDAIAGPKAKGAMSEAAEKAIDAELEKLSSLEKNSPEFNVTRNYLDWLTAVPWGEYSEENFDVAHARSVLDAKHYGMADVKDRILEFIAVGKLKRETPQGKIMCFVGPPGVGKTSIGQSIASSLGREFYRFSVGGLGDVAEIKGHRRTYIGAMPGKIIQCLKTTGTANPVILIDEIDKLGRGHSGDPASALLELLDPGQNGTFTDHYLDVPVDLSKALFICTANLTDTIPGPLLDRMEIIRLSGYDMPEKRAIAEQYLIPEARRAAGLALPGEEDEDGKKDGEADSGEEKEGEKDDEKGQEKDKDKEKEGPGEAEGEEEPITVPTTLGLDTEAVDALIRWYCREAGVRNLQKHVEKIYRKAALNVVMATEEERRSGPGDDDDWRITEDKLVDYVGLAPFTTDRLYEQMPAGVVMGLAWNAMGGATLYIETNVIRQTPAATAGSGSGGNGGGGGWGSSLTGGGGGSGGGDTGGGGSGGSLKITGQMGDVMKESAAIATTVARQQLGAYMPNNTFFDRSHVHLHVPEGATPKDGPSAGVTMVTALLSLALERPVRQDMAMTGEVSLTGKVLPVGGIKEKIIAARRSGMTCIVLPEANRRDFDDLPDYLRDGIEIHFAADYEDVFDVAFCEDRNADDWM